MEEISPVNKSHVNLKDLCCNVDRSAGVQKNGHLYFVRRQISQEEIFERSFEEVPQIHGGGRAFLSCVEEVKKTQLCSPQLGKIKIWAASGQLSESEGQKIARILDAILRCSSNQQCRTEVIRFAF